MGAGEALKAEAEETERRDTEGRETGEWVANFLRELKMHSPNGTMSVYARQKKQPLVVARKSSLLWSHRMKVPSSMTCDFASLVSNLVLLNCLFFVALLSYLSLLLLLLG